MNFTAKDKGSVYLRDQPADRVIYEGPIEPNQQLMVDVKANRALLGGRRTLPRPICESMRRTKFSSSPLNFMSIIR